MEKHFHSTQYKASQGGIVSESAASQATMVERH